MKLQGYSKSRGKKREFQGSSMQKNGKFPVVIVKSIENPAIYVLNFEGTIIFWKKSPLQIDTYDCDLSRILWDNRAFLDLRIT